MLWLVERGKIIVLHVRHAFWWKFSTYSVKRRGEILIFEVLSTSRARSSIFFILCFCMKIVRAKQAKSVLCLFCTTWPTCNNSKTLNLAQSSILIWRFRCSSRRSFLINLPSKQFTTGLRIISPKERSVPLRLPISLVNRIHKACT